MESRKSHADLADHYFGRSISRPVRSIAEFAEQELVLPADGGPHEGELFKFSRQPFTRLLIREIDVGPWTEFMITGPSQSGKTLICFVLLVAHTAAELRRNTVIGVPDGAMADNKWQIDIKPVFEASDSLSQLLPTRGPGSRGGTVKDTVTLTNGVVLKFMTPFGDDSNKAGFTAPIVVVTEAARFSNPSATSVESDPLRQLKARQRALSRFDENRELTTNRRMFVEGTVTLPDELPWKVKDNSTNTRIACPCQHCSEHVTPEREDLRDWDKADSELEAAKMASWYCPACGHAITDAERVEMNQLAVLLHGDQQVVDGETVGDPPATSQLFFRWNAFNNLFASTADIAVEEWKAKQLPKDSADAENAEKDLCQSIWCVPYTPRRLDMGPLKPAAIMRRTEPLLQGIAPADTEKLTVGVDVGRWMLWFVALAFRESGGIHVVDYGRRQTPLRRDEDVDDVNEHIAILATLREMAKRFEAGWRVHEGEGEIIMPDVVFVDRGYNEDAVHQFSKEKGGARDGLYMPILGRGRTQLQGNARGQATQYTAPTKLGNQVVAMGDGWHRSFVPSHQNFEVTLDADMSKIQVQQCLRTRIGRRGAMTLPSGDGHDVFARHCSAEVRRQIYDPEKAAIVEEWIKKGEQHLFDCAGYAFVAGKHEGWELEEKGEPQVVTNWFAQATGGRR